MKPANLDRNGATRNWSAGGEEQDGPVAELERERSLDNFRAESP